MTQSAEKAVFSLPGRLFLLFVILAGLAAISGSLYQLSGQPLAYQWYMLAALALISGSATVKVPSVPARISVSETFVFALVLLFGPAAGTVTVALDGLVSSYWIAKRRPEWYRALFNMTAPAISIWLASQVFFSVGHLQPLFSGSASVNTLLVPLILFTLADFGLNSWLIAFAVSLETRRSPYGIWRESFLWLSLNYFAGASVALLLVLYTRDVDFRFIGVILPLLIAVYFTFKTVNARVDDAERHVHQLNQLYLSTVETLAMAIDAKDQVTHGHIRRVQAVAVDLARHLGISDDLQIKAIETAALLHDMGKISVPAHILNKPGRLSDAEFEKMKLHASVGADILTAIEFPYPVVPIVRHHHENWDGTGYPAGLTGVEIPFGARILAVVDCFDALTSDRPYRTRLTDEQSIKILLERRGHMYDPLVVDTFVQIHQSTINEPSSSDFLTCAFSELPGSIQPLTALPLGADPRSHAVLDAPRFPTSAATDDTCDAFVKQLQRLVPCQLCVFYAYDKMTDSVVALFAMGEGADAVAGLRIAMGQRLSGWVAANRETMLNSDAALDLVDAPIIPRPRTCLSTALSLGDNLVGVLSLYSARVEGFSEQERRILESSSDKAAVAFKRLTEGGQRVQPRDLAPLPHLAI